MRVHFAAKLLACFFVGLVIPGDSVAGDLRLYPLPPEARAQVENLAAANDLLLLGEFHGTQEVPQIVASLLLPLTDLGYHILAIEVPHNYQDAVRAWASRKTETIPDFFANPSGDGIGNAQLLALTRIAASPPFRWQIICFDQAESTLEKQQRLALAQGQEREALHGPQLSFDDTIAPWRERDAAMASNLLKEVHLLKVKGKILAICGNLHARVTNDARDPMFSKLWPSFAGVLKQRQPASRVSSVNIEFHGGAFFNEGKVNEIRGRPLDHAVVRSGGQTGWNLVLSVPVASPATFLSSKRHTRDDAPAKSQAGGEP